LLYLGPSDGRSALQAKRHRRRLPLGLEGQRRQSRRNFQGLMDADQVVVHRVEQDGASVVFDLKRWLK
jgi:hypothetical protein